MDAVANAFTDAFRKKVLDLRFDAGLVSVWCKVISCVVFGIIIAGLALLHGTPPQLPNIGKGLNMSPELAFLLYISLNAVLEGTESTAPSPATETE